MPLAIYFLILLELLVVSYIDIKTKKISNYWSIINIVFCILSFSLLPHFYPLQSSIIVYPLAILFVGFVLFCVRVVGAGDVKLLATLFLLVPPYLHQDMFLQLTYLTILVGLSLLILNTIKNHRTLSKIFMDKNFYLLKNIYGTRFSFSPVILLSWPCLGWKINILNIQKIQSHLF
ncbi:MAG: prepilin peptidase [Oligoflexia bacterium]|nr:prepilin peptidase [Oligoflexia bacterium]